MARSRISLAAICWLVLLTTMLGLLPGRAAFASGESATGLSQDPPPLTATLTGPSTYIFDEPAFIDFTPVLGQGGVPPYT